MDDCIVVWGFPVPVFPWKLWKQLRPGNQDNIHETFSPILFDSEGTKKLL
jgi:hypothetical protein